jgi:hypothetical protein
LIAGGISVVIIMSVKGLGTKSQYDLHFGRLFALEFALRQLAQNFKDFRDRVVDCARSARPA